MVTGKIEAPLIQPTRTELDFVKHIANVVKLAPAAKHLFILDLCRTWDYADQVLARLGNGCVGGPLPNFGAA